jgi:hypothetical protein
LQPKDIVPDEKPEMLELTIPVVVFGYSTMFPVRIDALSLLQIADVSKRDL